MITLFVCLSSHEGLALLDSKMATRTGPSDVSEEPRGADSLRAPLCPSLSVSHLGSIQDPGIVDHSQESLRLNFSFSLEMRAWTEKLFCFRKSKKLNLLSLWTEMNSSYIEKNLKYCPCGDQIHHSLICEFSLFSELKRGAGCLQHVFYGSLWFLTNYWPCFSHFMCSFHKRNM